MVEKLSFFDIEIEGPSLIDRENSRDSRGFVKRIYCSDEFESVGKKISIKQINHTYTKNKGCVRGMHFQVKPFSEDKLVTCILGEIFDVVIDIRLDSPTFLGHHSQILSSKNSKSLLIPAGFAHGFQALSDDCHILYLHSENYSPDYEKGLNPMDPNLNIKWPLFVEEISEKDKTNPFIDTNFVGI